MKNVIKKIISFVTIMSFSLVFAVNASALTLTEEQVKSLDYNVYCPVIEWQIGFGNTTTDKGKDGSLLIKIPDFTEDLDYGFYKLILTVHLATGADQEQIIEGPTYAINYSASGHPHSSWTLSSTEASASEYGRVTLSAQLITDPIQTTQHFDATTLNSNIEDFDLELTYSGEAFDDVTNDVSAPANYRGLVNINFSEVNGGGDAQGDQDSSVITDNTSNTPGGTTDVDTPGGTTDVDTDPTGGNNGNNNTNNNYNYNYNYNDLAAYIYDYYNGYSQQSSGGYYQPYQGYLLPYRNYFMPYYSLYHPYGGFGLYNYGVYMPMYININIDKYYDVGDDLIY
jgi:hypothetical protein